MKYLNDFIMELKNRNYSRNTIKRYTYHLKKYLYFAQKTNYDPQNRIKVFLSEIEKSYEQRRGAWNSIQLFYKLVLKKECPYKLDKIKKKKRIPVIINRKLIIEILKNIKNTKHRLMIALIFAAGLRVSEVAKLKIKDININDLSMLIRDAKGKKDRIGVISDKLVPALRAVMKNRKAKEYLFLSNRGKKYSIRTVQKIFENARKVVEDKKVPKCHTLRHAFATELLKNGTDIRTIQELMGHKNIRTTMIYLHLSKPILKRVKSPL